MVIADHALARRSGYEVAAFIREHRELGPIPILLLASPFEPLDRERAEAVANRERQTLLRNIQAIEFDVLVEFILRRTA